MTINKKIIVLQHSGSAFSSFEELVEECSDDKLSLAHYVVGWNGEIRSLTHSSKPVYFDHMYELAPAAIKIVLFNYGPLKTKSDGYYTYFDLKVEDVYIDTNGNPWHAYTENCIRSALNLVKNLKQDHAITDYDRYSNLYYNMSCNPGPNFPFEKLKDI